MAALGTAIKPLADVLVLETNAIAEIEQMSTVHYVISSAHVTFLMEFATMDEVVTAHASAMLDGQVLIARLSAMVGHPTLAVGKEFAK